MALHLQNIPKNLEPWPGDWDLHVLNTCDFYFDEHVLIKMIDIASLPLYITCSHGFSDEGRITVLFKVEDEYYGAVLRRIVNFPNSFLDVNVFKLVEDIIDFNKIENISRENYTNIIQFKHSFLLIEEIGMITCGPPYETIIEIEKIITDHYKAGGDNDDFSEPLAPVDPVNSLGLQPISC